MDVRLTRKNDEQLKAHLKASIPYYAQQMLELGEYSDYQGAYEQSYYEILNHFENGKLKGHEIAWNVHDAKTDVIVGTLWHTLINRYDQDMVFVTWVGIDDDCRRKGYAKAAMLMGEQEMAKLGRTAFELYVFMNNTGAIKLYEQLGYKIAARKAQGYSKHVTRYMMHKNVDVDLKKD